jgi:hypothetical protein
MDKLCGCVCVCAAFAHRFAAGVLGGSTVGTASISVIDWIAKLEFAT